MMVIALQFYRGDFMRAMKLARLLADLEASRRDDVAVLFVTTCDYCPAGKIMADAVSACSEKFHVESLVVRPDTDDRRDKWHLVNHWPEGCHILWSAAVEYFLCHMSSMWTSIFTVDGGDGVPLYRNWVDVLQADHARTVASGKLVTGAVFPDCLGRWHVNGNMVLERKFLLEHPETMVVPPGTDVSWDVHHASSFLSFCRASSVVRCDWKRVGVRPDLFSLVAEHAVWWHGYKDGNFVDLSRNFIASGGARLVDVLDFGDALKLSSHGQGGQ